MMWKSLKTIISCKNREVVSEVMFGTEILNDMNHIVERFNEFYINSVSEIVNEIPKNDRYYQIEHNYNRFTNFHLLDKCELKTIIFSLANKSSPDDIGMIFYKDFFDVLADPLLNIINTSLQVGVVPDALKISTIVIIRKVAKTIKAEEFRPINMLAAIEKILEKVVYVQILQFVIENNLICKFQSGFREGHSCESALQYVINEWKEACDLGKVTGIVFLDLKRAFETVDRDRLLKKLKEYGLDGAVHKWLCSYLSGRMQKVKYDEYVSTASSINVGIPQGSILGPLLFILYINDMAALFSNCCYHLFADDTVIYITEESGESLVSRMNEVLKEVTEWLEVNKLKLNVSKTKSMIVGKQKFKYEIEQQGLEFRACGEVIEVVKEIKYLGVIIDDKLKFSSHINYVCKKIAKKIGVLKRVSWYLSIDSRKLVYNTIVLPHFNYCSTVLYLANQSDMDRLQKLQNRAMRVILRCNIYTRVNDMLKVLGWMNVYNYVEFNVLMFIHKIKLHVVPPYLQENVQTFEDFHNYNTRGRINFVLQRVNTTAAQRSIFFRGLNTYNSLSREAKQARNIASFKRIVRDIYI